MLSAALWLTVSASVAAPQPEQGILLGVGALAPWRPFIEGDFAAARSLGGCIPDFGGEDVTANDLPLKFSSRWS